ncbi:MAG: Uma2 family endonuclease [Candidatus Poribacteria bacterium]|nr:Uma2 family endonuclease [Candidatus Poribacteria bacterium]
MATSAVQTYLTPEEYITLERKAIPDAETVRSEYVKGKIIAMSGASRAHNLITSNISGELRNLLKGSKCETYANEMRVSTPSTSSYFYPDVVVVCEEPRFEDDVFDILLNPIILVEVLSPSTEAYDRGEKFMHYRELLSLQEYILVAQDKICIERFSRQDNNWILTDFQNLEERLPLISVQSELPLHEIYDRVTFLE